MLKARRAEYDQQRIGASPASDTNSRNDTSCDATTRDDNIGNDYSRSTSSEPPPDVKRARQRTRTLQVCQRSSSFGLRPRIETGDPSGARAKKGLITLWSAEGDNGSGCSSGAPELSGRVNWFYELSVKPSATSIPSSSAQWKCNARAWVTDKEDRGWDRCNRHQVAWRFGCNEGEHRPTMIRLRELMAKAQPPSVVP
jgi:hypothetical protein